MLSREPMNSDEVGVNISHVLIAGMINVENTDRHTLSLPALRLGSVSGCAAGQQRLGESGNRVSSVWV